MHEGGRVRSVDLPVESYSTKPYLKLSKPTADVEEEPSTERIVMHVLETLSQTRQHVEIVADRFPATRTLRAAAV